MRKRSVIIRSPVVRQANHRGEGVQGGAVPECGVG